MCGLNGIFAYSDYAPSVDREELLRTRERMIKRGPDGAGLWISDDSRIGLGHRRLAIIDLSSDGAQPMATADGRLRIVFNGEIYNYRELRQQLMTRGARFRSQSDTEVLLHLYTEYGTDMCRHLRGMYALAIWDAHDQSLFLARDVFGIKPLYYHDDGKTLRFASQVKALLAGGAVARDASLEGEQGYWIWGHVPEPYTLYRNVFAFKPGTWRLLRRVGGHSEGVTETVAGLLEMNRPSPVQPGSGLLRDALLDTVRHHLVADVPLGIFLSSGIDSATLVALAAECGQELRTLTLGFTEFKGTSEDETILAEQVARQYRTKHQTIWVSRADFEDAFQSFVDSMDQPSIDGLNTWLVARAAAQAGLKVALSGLGGDEFFGGYPSFAHLPQIRRIARPFAVMPGLGRLVRKASAPLLRAFTSEKYAGILEYGSSWEGAYMLRRAVRMPWELPELKRAAMLPGDKVERGSPPSHLIVSYLESTRYMRNQLLRDADWAAMAHSIELRVPLVDVELTKYIARRCQFGRPFSKQDLVSTANPPLPPAVATRPKTGFVVPVRDWMLQKHPSVSERGVRPWQALILKQAEVATSWDPDASILPVSHALWAPEMAAPGGVQNYMWRLWEMLHHGPQPMKAPKGLSLMDSTSELSAWPNPTTVRPNGAGGNKLRFMAQALGRPGRADLVTVGHVNQAPVAWVAKQLHLIQDYVIVLHGIEAWQRMSWMKRKALRHAKSVVVTTDFTARTCAELNGLTASNFRVIPLCAEPCPATPDPAFHLDGDWPILFVGRLDPSEKYKGLEALISAVAHMRRENLPVKLHVIGDGGDRPRLEAFAESEMPAAGSVQFHGRVTDAVLQAAYRSARTFVMPSAKEGFGIVFLEAMRHGVPCIGGAHGGTPEVFTDGEEGLLVKYGDAGMLADRLRELITSPNDARRIGEAGLRRFHRDYTFEMFAGRWRSALHIQSVADVQTRAPSAGAGTSCLTFDSSGSERETSVIL